jgi:hypothetical protein
VAYVKCGEGIHAKLKVFAAERNITMQELVEAWILAGITGDVVPTNGVLEGLAPPQRMLVERYAELMRSGKAAKHMKLIEGMIGLAEQTE